MLDRQISPLSFSFLEDRELAREPNVPNSWKMMVLYTYLQAIYSALRGLADLRKLN